MLKAKGYWSAEDSGYIPVTSSIQRGKRWRMTWWGGSGESEYYIVIDRREMFPECVFDSLHDRSVGA